MTKISNLFVNLKSDFASGLVVFLVALPLCLGIALASGAPLFSGIISGIIGGIIVGMLSRSHVSVSGPAAGLTAIVLVAITDLGSYPAFLTTVIIAGMIQLILGFIKAGSISNYFPTNVIEGMLAGIGIIIFLKQIPHAIGYDMVSEGDTSFFEKGGFTVIDSLLEALQFINYGSIIITLVALSILIIWNKIPFLQNLKLIPGALVAVLSGILINEIFIQTGSPLQVAKEHLVTLPIPETIDEFKAIFIFPDFSVHTLLNSSVWITGVTIPLSHQSKLFFVLKHLIGWIRIKDTPTQM